MVLESRLGAQHSIDSIATPKHRCPALHEYLTPFQISTTSCSPLSANPMLHAPLPNKHHHTPHPLRAHKPTSQYNNPHNFPSPPQPPTNSNTCTKRQSYPLNLSRSLLARFVRLVAIGARIGAAAGGVGPGVGVGTEVKGVVAVVVL